jgi:hypothetical protein
MKRDIYHIDWAENNTPLDPSMLKANSSWILPQLSALLGTLPLAKNDSELISVGLSLKRIVREIDSVTFSNGMPLTKEAINNMLKYLLRNNRSEILSGTQLKSTRYAAAVPFVLSAFKEQRNIAYSSWDTSDTMLKFFLEDDWYNALTFGNVPRFSNEELLEFRAKARTFRTGPKAGTQRTINATTAISTTGNAVFDSLPKYWKLALCQTWVFHPTNRHPLAITNPYNIDTPMEPLVSGDVLEVAQKSAKAVVDWDNMWNLVDAN